MEAAPCGLCDRKATGRSAAVWGSRVKTVDSDGAACETDSLLEGGGGGLWTDGQIGAASAAREVFFRAGPSPEVQWGILASWKEAVKTSCAIPVLSTSTFYRHLTVLQCDDSSQTGSPNMLVDDGLIRDKGTFFDLLLDKKAMRDDFRPLPSSARTLSLT